MKPAFLAAGLLATGLGLSSAAPFGFGDSSFSSPRFLARCYPEYCFSDGRGGLLWSLVSTPPNGFDGANGVRVGGLVRTTTNGVIDPGFVVDPALQQTMGVAVQTDGKILVGGWLVGDLAPNGAPNYRVFRFFTNGTLEVAYLSPVFARSPRFLTVLPDGKLLAAVTDLSDTTPPNGGLTGLARLNSNGAQDPDFHRASFTGGVAEVGIFAPLATGTNSTIYVAGGFAAVDGQTRQQVARLNPDGTLDPSFVPSGFVSSFYIRGVLEQPGGRAVIAGTLRLSGSFVSYPLMGLNGDGSRDPSFVLVPAATLNFTRARVLKETAEGRLLTVGTSMARFNSDGSLDDTFTRLPFLYYGSPGATATWFEQLPDGRIIIPSDPPHLIGPTEIDGQPFNGSVRLFPNGALDPAFSSPAFQQEIFPTAVTRQTDQRLLVAGAFDQAGSTATAGLARLNTNGTPDASYALTLSNVTSVLKLAPLPNNQTYALIQFTDYFNLVTSNALVRLQPDGTVDPTFHPDPGSMDLAEYFFPDLLLQSNQPVLVATARAQALLYQTDVPVTRFLADGSVDTNFYAHFAVPGSGTFADGAPITDWSQVTIDNVGELQVGDVQVLAAGADGKLLAAIGTNISATLYNYQLVRLKADGTPDASFSGVNVPAGSTAQATAVHDRFGNYGQVQTIYPARCLTAAVIQSNNAILFCGSFTNVDGLARPGIARLSPNSTLDPGFPLGAGPSTASLGPVKISSLSVDGAGKVWVTGNFTRWDGVDAPGYVRLNADGSVDTKCFPQTAHFGSDDYTVGSFSGALPGGTSECYVFGAHTLPGDLWPRALSRLVPYPPPPLLPVGMLPGLGFRISFTPESGESYWIQTSTDLRTWNNWLGISGTGQRLIFTDPAALGAPQKFYRLQYQQ